MIRSFLPLLVTAGLFLFAVLSHFATQEPSTALPVTSMQESNEQGSDKSNEKAEPLVSLGVNSTSEVSESSGVAICSFVPKTIWTHNDSGDAAFLYLLKTEGSLAAKVKVAGSKNADWESMSRFKFDGKSYLMVADVGDNAKRRRTYQLYVFPEPDLSGELNRDDVKLPIDKEVQCNCLEFAYPDGSKNCEAIAVDPIGRQIWLVEKVYVNVKQKSPPGIYVLPLSVKKTGSDKKPIIAERISKFPIRNVTGMDFSPDGKRLIIRNYLNSHLYSREKDETWEDVVKATNPETVVLPLQRQGEAVCFSEDSNSLILTSELRRQPIWQVELQAYFEKPRRFKKTKPKASDK